MSFYLLGLVVSVIGVVPLLVAGQPRKAVALGVVSTLVFGTLYYLVPPSLVWPWWGVAGISVLLLWLIVSLLASSINDKEESDKAFSRTFLFPVGLMLGMIFSFCRGCGMFVANDYANMIGEVEERVWTQDVQPKDPRHIRMASHENAVMLARQALGQAGAIGSQFQILEKSATPQFINGKFAIVVPLDFNGWLTWRATKKVPGYILVDGEDPRAPATVVMLKEGDQFVYTPGAYWGNNLERHLWSDGYYDKGLDSYTLEVDDNNKAWWTVTVYEPTIFASGERMVGVVIVDPVTGSSTFYPTGKIPVWVDFALPSEFASNYVNWHGQYRDGWVNSWNQRKNITQAEDPILVYGSDNQPYWVVGVTSDNVSDSSLVGLYYINSRTGKATFYRASGSTHEAIVDAVDMNEQVRYRHLHGTVPQIYNVYGTMTSVIPLLNDSHLFNGVAIVDVENLQVIGIGHDQFEALRAYQKALPVSEHQIAPELAAGLNKVTGKVDRIAVLPQGGEATFCVHLVDLPHVFTAGMSLSPDKLPLTQVGDDVTIQFYSSGESVEPMHTFENLSLPLESTVAQEEVRASGETTISRVEQRDEAAEVRARLNQLDDSQILLLQELLDKN